MTEMLPPDLRQFVRQELANGHHGSEQELVREAVRLLKDRNADLERLRAEIRESIAAIDRGEGIELAGDEALEVFFDEIEAEVAREQSAKQNASQ